MVSRKRLLLAVSSLMLVGCASTPSFDDYETKEKIYLASQNHRALIELYKSELKLRDSQEMREKLATIYVEKGEPNAAIELLSTLNEQMFNRNTALVLSNAYLEKGETERALGLAMKAYQKFGSDAEIDNLIGIIKATQKEYKEAREYFKSAKLNFHSDITVDNNLAMLDILEGNYEKASEILIKLYNEFPNDQSVKSNLMLALSKSGDFETLEYIFGTQMNRDEIAKYYVSFRQLDGV